MYFDEVLPTDPCTDFHSNSEYIEEEVVWGVGCAGRRVSGDELTYIIQRREEKIVKKKTKINKHVYRVALAISPKSLAHSVH